MSDDIQNAADNKLPTRRMALTSMILGIISLGYGFLTGIPAMILSVIAKKRGDSSRMVKAGFILSVIGCIIGVVTLIMWIYIFVMMQNM